jgi:hypothetical protein
MASNGLSPTFFSSFANRFDANAMFYAVLDFATIQNA